MKAHFVMLAEYNRWANERLYESAATLPAEALDRDLGAFFGSVLGTLNHLVVADLIWLARLQAAEPPRLGLDQRLHDDLAALRAVRADLDRRFIDHLTALDESAFLHPLDYRNSAGKLFAQQRSEVLAHVFNHQTHHRGQVHALLTRITGAAPPLDLICFQRAHVS